MFVKRRRPRSWWYPWIFVGGFVVVLLANMALLFFATLTFNGLETPEASDKRNAYSDAIRTAELQNRLGLEGSIWPQYRIAFRRWYGPACAHQF